MAHFTVARSVRAPATITWSTLTDWPRHAGWVPLTTVGVTTDRPDGVGAGFVARTGVGRLAFDDPMTVTVWQPPGGDAPGDRPGRCEVQKRGDFIRGRAWFTVTPLAGGHSHVVWGEDVTVWPHRLARFTAPAFTVIGRVGFAATLRAMAREAASAAP
ncbi:hypothetical protein [Actinoplanes derwentensis]|nr:hypothetical protein [Actinoplanes derwentensis]